MHANFIRPYIPEENFGDTEYMQLLIDLAFYNLFITYNTSHEILDKINEKVDTRTFIENLAVTEIKHWISFLYPTQPEYYEHLELKLTYDK